MRPTINGKDTAPKNPRATGKRSLTGVLSNYSNKIEETETRTVTYDVKRRMDEIDE